jgi:DNA-binding NtrC family response regulator
MLYRVLVAIDDRDLRARLRTALAAPGTLIHPIGTRRELWKRLVREAADVVVIEVGLIPRPWRAALGALRAAPDAPDVVVLTDDAEDSQHARLLGAGAAIALSRTVSTEALSEALASLRRSRGRRALDRLRGFGETGEPRLSDFVSASPAMQTFLDVLERVVESDASLLILGETGVGKEHLARAVHAESSRSSGPFVAVNCAALPPPLLESELFGHTAGAFTGAVQARRGRFEIAHAGTLFLDEIGEMETPMQAKLLRAVQDRAIQPIGGEHSVRVDVRLMAASNRDLAVEAERGTFRPDLYYRLSVVTLVVPPLRERKEDIPELSERFLVHFSESTGSRPLSMSDDVREAFRAYPWPGNVRELRNVIERAVLLCDSARIELDDLPESMGRVRASDAPAPAFGAPDADAEAPPEPWAVVRRRALGQVERAYLASLLRHCRGRVGDAARVAGISPRSLYEKMRANELRKEDFRD